MKACYLVVCQVRMQQAQQLAAGAVVGLLQAPRERGPLAARSPSRDADVLVLRGRV